MKVSIRTRVSLVLIGFAGVILMLAFAAALYGMAWGRDFATHYAKEISNSSIHNSSDIIVSMRRNELLTLVEQTAAGIDEFTTDVRRDVHLLKLEMERILADPEGYKRTPVPAARPEQVLDENIPIEEYGDRVFSFITYAPGIDPASLQEEIAVTSNIQDFLIAFSERAVQRGAHQTGVLGAKSGFLMKADVGASPLNLEFRQSAWYRAAMEKGELAFTPVYRTQGRKIEAAIACTEPYSKDGEVMGVIGFGMGLEELSKLMRDDLDTIIEANQDGINFLLDERGKVIFCQYEEGSQDEFLADFSSQAVRSADFPKIENTVFMDAVDEMRNGAKGVVSFEQDGKGYTFAYVPVKGMGWSVGAVIPMPTVEVLAEKNRQQILALTNEHIQELEATMGQRNLWFALIILLLAAWGLYGGRRLSDRLVRPLLNLRNGINSIAAGDFDHRIEIATGDEIEEVADAVNSMAVELKAYIENLKKITAEEERIQAELDTAKGIQVGMLPHVFPRHTAFDIFASMEAAKSVGGDFYDFYFLDENHFAITIADVSDKGVAAALFMARAKTILKNGALSARRLAAGAETDWGLVVAQANNQLCEDNDEMQFVTVFFGVLDLETGEFSYVNGGHNPPLWGHGPGERMVWEYLRQEKRNNMLGAIEESEYDTVRLTLSPGDMLYLYTDGVTEAMNEKQEQYSERRLHEVLTRIAQGGKSSEDIILTLRADMKEFVQDAEQSDDITMLGVRFLGV